MKLLSLLRQFSKGIRLPALVLVVIMTLSMWLCVSLYGDINYIISDIMNFGGTYSENTFYAETTGLKILELNTEKDSAYVEKRVKLLAQDDRVEAVLPIIEIPRASYQKESVKMIIYSTEMTKYVQGLVRYGINFSKNPNGCVISGDLFQSFQPGDSIDLFIGKKTVSIPVASKLKAPYRYMEYTKYSNGLVVSDLYAGSEDDNVVIMQATENVMAQIVAKENSGRYSFRNNFVVVFKENVSHEDQNQLLLDAGLPHQLFSFEKVMKNSEVVTYNRLKAAVPFPLFMLSASIAAYLSISFLIFKRKEGELAVFYLSGNSSLRCAGLMFLVFTLIALVPIIVNLLIVHFWPEPWGYLMSRMDNFLLDSNILKNQILLSYFMDIRNTIYDSAIDSGAYTVIFLFYGITAVIAMLTTFFAMRKHSPLTYLRGVNE